VCIGFLAGTELERLLGLPGVPAEGLDITLEPWVLTIRARSADMQQAGHQRVYTGYAAEDFERVFTLSEDIDRDRIETTAAMAFCIPFSPKRGTPKLRKIELEKRTDLNEMRAVSSATPGRQRQNLDARYCVGIS
jgi:Hsp20/alpha crystallin family